MSETKTTTSKSVTAGANAKPRKTKASRATAVPWIEAGIDYGPALVAIEELIAWAFDLVGARVADWPDGKRRVGNARRTVAKAFRGKRAPRSLQADDDVAFTALLLIRILDADLKLSMGDTIEVLSALGLPTFDVPRPRPGARARHAAPQPAIDAAELATLIDAIERGAGLERGARPAPVVPLRRPTRAGHGPAVASPCAGCCLARPGFAVAA